MAAKVPVPKTRVRARAKRTLLTQNFIAILPSRFNYPDQIIGSRMAMTPVLIAGKDYPGDFPAMAS
jgi:hypothetical protein